MSNPHPGPSDLQDEASSASRAGAPPRAGFWVRQLPYGVVLILTLFGIAYTSFSKRPFILYWMFLALVVCVVCVWTGWRRASDRDARARLIWTQVLHWLAFLAAMNLLLLNTVQSMLNADATGLAILMLLALGTFIAGVHMLAWEICVLGVVMAFFVPAIAWIEELALLLLMVAVVLAGIGLTFWWIGSRRPKAG